MASVPSDLPDYEETVSRLVEKLERLSTIHRGLGDATESLVAAHWEFEETKRNIALLVESTQATLAEVQRLQPAELASTFDTRLTSFSREASDHADAVNGHLAMISKELSASRVQLDIGISLIDRRLTMQDEALPAQFSVMEDSIDSSLAELENSLAELLTTSHQATRSALAIVLERQDSLSHAIVDVQGQQGELLRRYEVLLERQVEYGRQQSDTARRLESIAAEVVEVRQTADSMNSTASSIRQVTDNIGPITATVLRPVHQDIGAQIGRLRRVQIALLLLVITAVALVSAVLIGIVPGA